MNDDLRERTDPGDSPGTEEDRAAKKLLGSLYDLFEVFGMMTAIVMILFAFGVRLNIVDGSSMRQTLSDGDNLVVSSLFWTPAPGDIVIVHKIDASPYDRPIVKRVIATGGQTVDIDFDTWTLRVDGEVVEEPYRWLNREKKLLTCEYPLPVTLKENEFFVMGDNRNGSADSRQIELGPVDRRCIVGRALVRITPDFTVFSRASKD